MRGFDIIAGSKPQYHEITGTIVAETAAAILFEHTDDDGVVQKHWYPLSQIRKVTNSPNIGEDKIDVKTWLLDKKEIAY